jgi:5-methylcytosine-specific restriction protein A
MAERAFRTDRSIASEIATRARVKPLLERHGFTITGGEWIKRGTAITQVVEAEVGHMPPLRIHVRLCWRRDGRKPGEDLYSATQLRARLVEGDWDKTLTKIAARIERERYTHLLLVQDSLEGFVFAALVPSSEIPSIWRRQREVSDELLARGLVPGTTKNHATNGASPTLWLQDDRHPATPAVARVLWNWPGVVNVLALPRLDAVEADTDSVDDLPQSDRELGRDGAERTTRPRSGYPRDARVRAAVRDRAAGRCERAGCAEQRSYSGFLDVHHILGVDVSDRVWTCVALCPNCHREAHFAPDRDAINEALRIFASRFAG